MRRREIHRRKPSRAATWIAGILITLIGGGVIVTFINTYQQNPSETKKAAVLFALTLACVGAILLALKAKTWIRNEWWPRFVERRMMAILGDSVNHLHEETGRGKLSTFWPSSIKNTIVEATHELESRGRELASLRAQVTELTAENKRLEHTRLTLGSLLDRLAEVTEAIYDTPSQDLVRQNADGDTVPNAAILARIRWELGVSVISTATIVGISPDEILEHWNGMSSAAKQVLCWHRHGEMGRPLPENWVRAIENRILDEELKRQPPHEPTEPAPA